jgi:1-deoxy-D-xylulose-5-phosphate synthase
VTTPVRLHGIPQQFLDHAKRASILERIGLTAQTIARRTVEDISELDAATAPHPATDPA